MPSVMDRGVSFRNLPSQFGRGFMVFLCLFPFLKKVQSHREEVYQLCREGPVVELVWSFISSFGTGIAFESTNSLV